jgi:hypothetical protein
MPQDLEQQTRKARTKLLLLTLGELKPKMPQIQVDPPRMVANGVTVDEVLQATSDTLDSGMMQYSSGATIGTGGFLETPNQRLYIRHVQPILTSDDLAHVAIDGGSGLPRQLDQHRGGQSEAVDCLRIRTSSRSGKLESVPDAGPMDRANRRHSSRAKNFSKRSMQALTDPFNHGVVYLAQ